MINIENLDIKKFDCTGCALCASICPTKAISIELDDEGFLNYKIDEKKCINCGRCILKCPQICEKPVVEKPLKTYAAYINDEQILNESSSGGIFTALASKIIEDGGIVFGASFENYKLQHVCVSLKKDLDKLRGSKYLQSDTTKIYEKINDFLYLDKKVMFVGLPCQVIAVKEYFAAKKMLQNLILVDLVCHGVPSINVLEKSLEDRYAGKVTSIDFRNKKFGWKNYHLVYFNSNGKILKSVKSSKDEFFAGYVKNMYLKKSCYNCNSNVIPRQSDISLGDFWGINIIDKEFDKENNDRGVSIVLINTKTGSELFSSIKENITFKEESLEEAIKYNPRIESGKYDLQDLEKRNNFFKNERNVSFKKRRFVNRKSFIKKIIKKIGVERFENKKFNK